MGNPSCLEPSALLRRAGLEYSVRVSEGPWPHTATPSTATSLLEGRIMVMDSHKGPPCVVRLPSCPIESDPRLSLLLTHH